MSSSFGRPITYILPLTYITVYLKCCVRYLVCINLATYRLHVFFSVVLDDALLYCCISSRPVAVNCSWCRFHHLVQKAIMGPASDYLVNKVSRNGDVKSVNLMHSLYLSYDCCHVSDSLNVVNTRNRWNIVLQLVAWQAVTANTSTHSTATVAATNPKSDASRHPWLFIDDGNKSRSSYVTLICCLSRIRVPRNGARERHCRSRGWYNFLASSRTLIVKVATVS
jgi:hypothetical protein